MGLVDQNINRFPKATQDFLRQIRQIILNEAPDAEEYFSYGMPAYKWCGKPLVYYAAFQKHIGFYATPFGHSTFREELSHYIHGKGSVQFPTDEPLPFDLIRPRGAFRKAENEHILSMKQLTSKT